MRPWASRSAIQVASLTSLLRPGMLRICMALARTSANRPSRTRQTGFQYTPVDSSGDVRAAVSHQPVAQRRQFPGGGAEGPPLMRDGRTRHDARTGHDGLLMNIEPRALRMLQVHNRLLDDVASAWSPRQRSL